MPDQEREKPLPVAVDGNFRFRVYGGGRAAPAGRPLFRRMNEEELRAREARRAVQRAQQEAEAFEAQRHQEELRHWHQQYQERVLQELANGGHIVMADDIVVPPIHYVPNEAAPPAPAAPAAGGNYIPAANFQAAADLQEQLRILGDDLPEKDADPRRRARPKRRIEPMKRREEEPEAQSEPPPSPVDLTKYFGRARNRIKLVGYEVEGGWVNLPPGKNRVNHDGSVFRERDGAPHYPVDGVEFDEHHRGEIATDPPIEIAYITPWILANHPSHVDKTCGLHVHMSFSDRHYQMLMDSEEYQETLLHYLGEWGRENQIPQDHCLWSRLRGESEYCQKVWWPELQVQRKGDKGHNRQAKGHRYTILHFGRHLHGTVECRVLPMFKDPKLSASAAYRVLEITNAYLLYRKKKEKPAVVNLSLKEDVYERVTRRKI